MTSATQSNVVYAVQSCSSAESFRGTAQCCSSVIDFSKGAEVTSVVQRESDYAGRVVAVHRSLDVSTNP